ncbi:hypothetical protein DAPPUDRAFT_104843 [Daphnia pulex]|uniref:Uncharacterized protein n=1 Tax=Daphnia pulex TaxID=6669 RepID=E9GNI3_DAPPU|nr:hypothetical protein DAPPUDRAFT_104843 [Daphnia pulex]|eukprot:EFX78768.1 hypothetical protein DAPPUDRAFT_104843 [Daphnia pulex]
MDSKASHSDLLICRAFSIVLVRVEGIGFKPATHVDPTVTSPGLAIFTPSPLKSSNKTENTSSTISVAANTSTVPTTTTTTTTSTTAGEFIQKGPATIINPLAKPIANKKAEEEQSTIALPTSPASASHSNHNTPAADTDATSYNKNQHHGPSIGNKVNSNPLANNSYNMPLGSSGSKSGAVLPAHSDGHSNPLFQLYSTRLDFMERHSDNELSARKFSARCFRLAHTKKNLTKISKDRLTIW